MRILNDFDKWLMSDEKREKISHYASSVTSCRRQQYYQWIGQEESNPKKPGDILKMKFGFLAEDLLEKFFSDSIRDGIKVDGKNLIRYETGWKERYKIEGLKYPVTCKLDFLLFFDDGSTEAIELKSSFGRGIVDIAKKQQPRKEYLDQLFVYIHLTPFKNFNHPYLGRDSGYRTEFEVNEHEKGLEVIYTTLEGIKRTKIYEYNFDDMVDRLKEIEFCVENKTVPDRDHQVAIKNGEIKDKFQHQKVLYKSEWQCLWCGWKDFCWSGVPEKYIDGTNSGEFIDKMIDNAEKRGKEKNEL